MTPSLDKDSTPKRKMYYITSGQLERFAGQAFPAERSLNAEQVKELQELTPEQMAIIFPPNPRSPIPNYLVTVTDEELQAEIDRRIHALSIRLGVDLPQSDSTSWQIKPGQMMVLPEPQPMQVELTPAALQGIADAIQHAVGEGMIEGFRWKMG